MTETDIEALRHQARDRCDRCLYTSTSLFIWLRALRLLRIGFIVVPMVLGAFAGWDLLQAVPGAQVLTAICAFVAGLVPALYAGLKLDEHLPLAARLAGEYKNLEILFGDLARIGPAKTFSDFEAEYVAARNRLEGANAEAYTAPEWCFRSARKKIMAGHYEYLEPSSLAKPESDGTPPS